MIERFPEQIIAEGEPEHMKDRCSARVDICTVRTDADDRLSAKCLIRIDAGLLGVVHNIDEFIPAERKFKVKRIEITGKTFVQPEMPPVFARYHIAPPLMRHFVGNKANGGFVNAGAGVIHGNSVH